MSKKFQPSKAAELRFQKSLQKIARASGDMVVKAYLRETGKGVATEEAVKKFVKKMPELNKALEAYSRALTPWAKKQAQKLLSDTTKKIYTDKSYREHSKRIGQEISRELFESETGLITMALVSEQVDLITSIPTEAGARAQKLALEGIASGRRADEIASELMKTTDVTESRAKLIARTETARANTALNLARSTSVGSTHYRWRNSGDADVRDSHRYYHGKKLDGQVFAWNSPPTLDDGMTGHPGTFPNCRCYAEPILPEE